MRLVVQRVKKAQVARVEDGAVVGKIKQGFLVLLGIKKGDNHSMADNLSEKLSKLRILADGNDKMNLSIKDVAGEILLVSQFTLYADTSAGNRPSFIQAENPAKAKELYEYFILKLRDKGLKIETGSFGDYMKIEASLDGPVTILLE